MANKALKLATQRSRLAMPVKTLASNAKMPAQKKKTNKKVGCPDDR